MANDALLIFLKQRPSSNRRKRSHLQVGHEAVEFLPRRFGRTEAGTPVAVCCFGPALEVIRYGVSTRARPSDGGVRYQILGIVPSSRHLRLKDSPGNTAISQIIKRQRKTMQPAMAISAEVWQAIFDQIRSYAMVEHEGRTVQFRSQLGVRVPSNSYYEPRSTAQVTPSPLGLNGEAIQRSNQASTRLRLIEEEARTLKVRYTTEIIGIRDDLNLRDIERRHLYGTRWAWLESNLRFLRRVYQYEYLAKNGHDGPARLQGQVFECNYLQFFDWLERKKNYYSGWSSRSFLDWVIREASAITVTASFFWESKAFETLLSCAATEKRHRTYRFLAYLASELGWQDLINEYDALGPDPNVLVSQLNELHQQIDCFNLPLPQVLSSLPQPFRN